MATAAASSETTATATVVRATERQVRLKLGKDLGDREVTKRVAVPEEVRDTIEGAVVPIVVTGSGPKAKVELAQGWAATIGDGAKKPATRKRTRGAKAEAAKPAAEPKARTRGSRKPKEASAAEADAPKKRTRGAKAEAAEASTNAPKGRARKAKAEPAEETAAPSGRARGRRKPTTKAVPPASPALIRKQIAAAVQLVRDARR